jgi:hypothetical protein
VDSSGTFDAAIAPDGFSDGGPVGGDSGARPTPVTCATLSAAPTLGTGQAYLLDLTGAPACKLPAGADLVIGGAGTELTVQNGTLEVQGNIALSVSGTFTVSHGTLQLDNSSNCEHNIDASGSAAFVFDHSTLVTNATGVNNIAACYNASGNSTAQFLYSNLPSGNSWLLAMMNGSASLVAQNSNQVPCETYIRESSQVEIRDDQVPSHLRARNGLWLDFESGTSGTVTLPDQTAPFTWAAGQGQPGYANVNWSLHVTTATPGIGVEPHAGSSVSVTGRGAANKEIGFSINFDPAVGSAIANAMAEASYSFSDPPLNLVTSFSLPPLPGAAASELTLQNVNVGALAWQVYVGGGMGAPPITVNLGSGAFNELAAAPGGHLNLTGTTTQLAVLEATGPGAVLTATNADLWSQTLQADSMGTLSLVGSVVHGGVLAATNGGTLQLDDDTALWADGVTTPPNCVFGDDYDWMLAHNGRPECNPYSNPTKMSTRTVTGNGSALVANQTHPACPWSGAAYAPAVDFETGPTVSGTSPGSVSCVPVAGATVTGAVGSYPSLLTGLQPATSYTCTLTQGASSQSYSITTSACLY